MICLLRLFVFHHLCAAAAGGAALTGVTNLISPTPPPSLEWSTPVPGPIGPGVPAKPDQPPTQNPPDYPKIVPHVHREYHRTPPPKPRNAGEPLLSGVLEPYVPPLQTSDPPVTTNQTPSSAPSGIRAGGGIPIPVPVPTLGGRRNDHNTNSNHDTTQTQVTQQQQQYDSGGGRPVGVGGRPPSHLYQQTPGIQYQQSPLSQTSTLPPPGTQGRYQHSPGGRHNGYQNDSLDGAQSGNSDTRRTGDHLSQGSHADTTQAGAANVPHTQRPPGEHNYTYPQQGQHDRYPHNNRPPPSAEPNTAPYGNQGYRTNGWPGHGDGQLQPTTQWATAGGGRYDNQVGMIEGGENHYGGYSPNHPGAPGNRQWAPGGSTQQTAQPLHNPGGRQSQYQGSPADYRAHQPLGRQQYPQTATAPDHYTTTNPWPGRYSDLAGPERSQQTGPNWGNQPPGTHTRPTDGERRGVPSHNTYQQSPNNYHRDPYSPRQSDGHPRSGPMQSPWTSPRGEDSRSDVVARADDGFTPYDGRERPDRSQSHDEVPVGPSNLSTQPGHPSQSIYSETPYYPSQQHNSAQRTHQFPPYNKERPADMPYGGSGSTYGNGNSRWDQSIASTASGPRHSLSRQSPSIGYGSDGQSSDSSSGFWSELARPGNARDSDIPNFTQDDRQRRSSDRPSEYLFRAHPPGGPPSVPTRPEMVSERNRPRQYSSVSASRPASRSGGGGGSRGGRH